MKGELYDEELLAKRLKEKGLLDDEGVARAKRVRARLYEFELPRALDRILFDLGLVGKEELEEAIKASKISDAPTEHIPAAIMAGHAAKAKTEVREKLDKMRRALDKPKKAGEHAGAARAVPPAAIVAVCGAVVVVALTVLVVRFLPAEIPQPDPEGKLRDFEPYAKEDALDGLLGRVGFMHASPGQIFVERRDGSRVPLGLRRIREDARRYASSAKDTAEALAALRAGMMLSRSNDERARFLLDAAKTAEGRLALELLRKLRELYGGMTPLIGESYIVEGEKAADDAARCRAYRTYLALYPRGKFVEHARVGLVEAGSSPTRLPQPGGTPVWPEGSRVVVSESFEEPPGPGVHGTRVEDALDPGPDRGVLTATGESGERLLRAFVVLREAEQASSNLRVGFRAWAREEGLLEVSVLVLDAREPRWLGFRCRVGPRWKTASFPLGEIDGLRVHSVSFVAPAEAGKLYIDDLALFEPPR